MAVGNKPHYPKESIISIHKAMKLFSTYRGIIDSLGNISQVVMILAKVQTFLFYRMKYLMLVINKAFLYLLLLMYQSLL